MPQTFMEWVAVVAAVAAVLAVIVAFMRRPKKTTNKITDGDGNAQKGGDGTTSNTIKGGNKNKQDG
ncbi:MAG: LPS O-antigen subunit length determinant protein (WzzB/FepE family) [Gammaproteobacteria bacterium]|jgi:LPS O-antigen subunit length determinant protein (WzzB/FepE family)